MRKQINKKVLHKTVISKNDTDKRNAHKQLQLSLLFLLSGLVFLFFAMHNNFYQPEKASKQIAHREVLAAIQQRHMPLTSTPSPLPTATPVTNDVGDFCLQVPVLFYHHIEPIAQASAQGHAQLTVDSNWFDKQMHYLVSAGYHSISADDLAHALLARQQLPPKSVVITMDDGYSDIYQYAFPILKKYTIIGNLMIPAGLIDNPDYMTWLQLQQMVKSPDIRVYNHSYSHADVAHADLTKLQNEIVTPNTELQTKLGRKVDIFTYPYGSFSDATIVFLKQHGFIAAFSTLPGTLQCKSQIMRLSRTRIGNASLSDYGF